MRTGTVSAISVLLISICSPHPATAQSNASSPSMPQTSPQKAAGPARLVELPKGAEIRSVPLRTDSTNGPTNPPQSWNLLAQQNRSNVDQLWSFKKGILPQLEATRCTCPRSSDCHLVFEIPVPQWCPETSVVWYRFHQALPSWHQRESSRHRTPGYD